MQTNDNTRRDFLKASLFSMPFILSRSLRAANRIRPASDRITLGHIGVGGQGGYLLSNFLQLEESQSIAVCDCFASRRTERQAQIDAFYTKKQGKPYTGTRVYSDFRELLAADDIDAVVIATPDHWHVPVALAAVQAGKDVYVEKPLGISVALNQALRAAVQRSGAIFQYGTQQRSDRDFRFACELVRNGYIGKVHTVDTWCADIHSQETAFVGLNGSMAPIPVPPDFDYDMWLGVAPVTPYTADRCSSFGSWHHYDNALGFIAGWGAHPLDVAQWGLDTDHTAPVEYSGSGQIPQGGMFETVSDWDVWCTYEDGVRMHFMSEGVARKSVPSYLPVFRDHGTCFIGDKGWVSVDRTWVQASPASLLSVKISPQEINLYQSSNHYRNFVESVRTRRQAICTVESAVQSDMISHLSDIAIRTGRTIHWDPKKEIIVNDAIASRYLSRPLRSPWHLG